MIQTIRALKVLVPEDDYASAGTQSQQLEETIELKSAFLRLTAHELRRPVGLASGYVSLLRDGSYGPVPEQMETGLQQVDKSLQEMRTMVDALAQAARMEDAAEALNLSRCDMREVIAQAVAGVDVEAANKTIVIQVCDPQEALEAVIDADRLRVALVNLLSNAVKYAPTGTSVVVGARTNGREIRVTVTDHGPGMEAGEATRAFNRWVRLDTGSPGLGLGLYIVREIAEMHGGRVTVVSRPGRGSTFAIVVPTVGPTRL